MAIDAFVRPLLGVELFQGLRPLQISEIARRADRIVFKPGEVIVAEDTTGDAAILIVAGEAARISGPGLPGDIEEVAPGSLVAEMAMLVDTVHSSTVVARSAVRALRISRSELLEQMEADPALAEHFVARISGRLGRLAAELRAVDNALVAAHTGPDAAARTTTSTVH
jgi:CRP-like cAMP-binding protein